MALRPSREHPVAMAAEHRSEHQPERPIERLLFIADAAVADAGELPPSVGELIGEAGELYVVPPSLPRLFVRGLLKILLPGEYIAEIARVIMSVMLDHAGGFDHRNDLRFYFAWVECFPRDICKAPVRH